MSFAYRNLLLSPLQWVIVDARHDSTANAYHTTVPCLSGRYMLGVQLHLSLGLL